MGDLIQFVPRGIPPAKPVNHRAVRAFYLGPRALEGDGGISSDRYPDDLVMPCADPSIAGFDMTDFISDSGDCA